jgi:hypothetical protein
MSRLCSAVKSPDWGEPAAGAAAVEEVESIVMFFSLVFVDVPAGLAEC